MQPTDSAGGPSRPRYLLLGEVLRPHGVAGELRVRVLTAYPERLSKLKTVYLGRGPESPDAKAYRLQAVRFNQGYALMKLRGVNSRDQADQFRERFVMVAIEDAVPLDEGEVYLFQLIGMTVQTQDEQVIGTIKDVLETGANDVYIVDSPQYGEVLIPATEHTIVKKDAENRRITVILPEGLLPDT
jgi:16S rRNA processing protein RimM